MSEATTADVETPDTEVETEQVAGSQTTDDQHQDETDEAAVEGDDPDQAGDEGDDLEEVEWEGVKARIPPQIKAALLRQADYTQKTQKLAEARQAVEAARETATHQAKAAEALAEDFGRVHALQATVDYYENIDWQALRQEDRENGTDRALTLWMQSQKAEKDLAAAKSALDTKRTQHLQEQQTAAQQRTVQAIQETLESLAGQGFTDADLEKVAAYAQTELGFSREQFRKVADSEVTWKALHGRMTAEAEVKKLRTQLKAKTTAATHEQNQQVQPAARTNGNAPPQGIHDGLGTDAWIRRRNEQLARKRA